jgi:hypothetical protein
MQPRWQQNSAGRYFTLKKILTAGVTIVLFGAVAVSIVMHRTENAKRIKARADCKSLAEQANEYELKYGSPPQTLAQLAQPGADRSSPFIESSDLIDPWGHKYQYVASPRSGCGQAVVYAMGCADPSGVAVSMRGVVCRFCPYVRTIWPRPRFNESDVIGSWQR